MPARTLGNKHTHTWCHTYINPSHTYCICLCCLIYTHAHVHVHRRKIGCALFQSQSTFIRAVNVNWRAVLGKQKTHFLKLTRFHRFGLSAPCFLAHSFCLTRDERSPALPPQALMGKVCAWHCILFTLRKYVLLCAILLSACGNEGAQKRQTFDRQEWYYDILMCSTAGKYSSCLHFLF